MDFINHMYQMISSALGGNQAQQGHTTVATPAQQNNLQPVAHLPNGPMAQLPYMSHQGTPAQPTAQPNQFNMLTQPPGGQYSAYSTLPSVDPRQLPYHPQYNPYGQVNMMQQGNFTPYAAYNTLPYVGGPAPQE